MAPSVGVVTEEGSSLDVEVEVARAPRRAGGLYLRSSACNSLALYDLVIRKRCCGAVHGVLLAF
jgi:hypothetical protein